MKWMRRTQQTWTIERPRWTQFNESIKFHETLNEKWIHYYNIQPDEKLKIKFKSTNPIKWK